MTADEILKDLHAEFMRQYRTFVPYATRDGKKRKRRQITYYRLGQQMPIKKNGRTTHWPASGVKKVLRREVNAHFETVVKIASALGKKICLN